MLAGSLEAPLRWTVQQVIEHLQGFKPDSLVFFHDRLGRNPVEHDEVNVRGYSSDGIIRDRTITTLDVVIGVLEA